MCGRYVFSGKLQTLKDLYGAEPDGSMDLSPIFNVAPTFDMPVIKQSEEGRQISLYRWGLLPIWAKDTSVSYKMINARSETLDQKNPSKTPSGREDALFLHQDSMNGRKRLKGRSPITSTQVMENCFHLLHPSPDDGLTFYPVSTKVNSPKYQGSELIEPEIREM